MRKRRFTQNKMVEILREADTGSVAEVVKRHAVHEQTTSAWRKPYGELERKTTWLKHLEAERNLAINEISKVAQKVVSADVRRSQVLYGVGRGLTERGAYHFCNVDRSSLRYASRLKESNA